MEDEYLDTYWEDQCEPYMGEDYNVFEERQLDLDRECGEFEDDWSDELPESYDPLDDDF